jgi:hypothetical protein
MLEEDRGIFSMPLEKRLVGEIMHETRRREDDTSKWTSDIKILFTTKRPEAEEVKRRHVENHKSGAAHLVKERKRKTLNDPPIAIVNQTYLELPVCKLHITDKCQ